MGHAQRPTPLITDNNTAHGLTTGSMIPKRSKAVDMRFHWLKYREAQKRFNIKWKQGDTNREDYHSKNHPPHPPPTAATMICCECSRCCRE
eukprot:14617217-Ditylum_brightwellii.AAC.1